MKIAIPVWDNDIATVLDFSKVLLVVEVEKKTIKNRTKINWELCNDAQKIALLEEERISILLCGALSRSMQAMIQESGIEVVPFLRGAIDSVLDAYFEGRISDKTFQLPGCARPGCDGKRRGRMRRIEC
jgi:predicted Fe-Mo cluster-binding NifX family protein